MNERLFQIWVYLSQTPLLWLTVTVAAYAGADALYQRSHRFALLHPVLLSIVALVVTLLITGTPYETYFEGAQFVHFLLGPAVVALAVPLYHAAKTLRRMALPLVAALLIGSLAAIGLGVGIGAALGLTGEVLKSLAPKSITTPIAMGVSEQIGGLPSLTAVFVIVSGIIGALFAPAALDLIREKEQSIRGFAMGLASHGIGTARALQIDEEAGAFAGLAMGLNGLLTSVLVPLIARLAGW